jgi:hypothetical protein
MRATLARAAGLAAVLLSTLTLSATPAAAGGPTSAFLSIPGAGSTASLYYTDPEYGELSDLVGITGPAPSEQGSGGHEAGPGVTVTWLIHDVQVWRVDRIYLDAEGGPWIATQTSMDEPIWESPVIWHRPTDGKRLADLLDGLGLGDGASKNSSSDGVAGAPVPDNSDTTATPPAEVDAQPAAADESTWLASAGWALGGLVGGALLTLAWTRRRPVPAEESPSSVERPDGFAEVLAR